MTLSQYLTVCSLPPSTAELNLLLQNIIGLIPLALILGEITEDLAVRFGPTVGGLLNATFGNVVELILSIVALTKELYTVVAASLIGSILSNLLLVLGAVLVHSNLSSYCIYAHSWGLICAFVPPCNLLFIIILLIFIIIIVAF